MVIEHPGRGDIPELSRLWQLAFGDDMAFISAFFATGFASDRCRCIRHQGRIGAVLYWFDVYGGEEKYAYLYAVATHPDFRGRGLCRELMADTHGLLARRGYAGALLVPQQEGLRKMYASFGYEDWCGVGSLSCGTGERPAVLRPLSQAEYALLRREYLPAGGIVQEGANLDFLSSYGSFYAGEDFLLAMAEDKGKLLGIELLGNTAAAPEIVKAFGCREGSFRTPGDTRLFAMGISFGGKAKRPSYFGLAFD